MIITLTKGPVPLPIDREICTRLADGRADTFLHIVPTDHACLKWCCDYLRKTPNRAVAGLHIYTLDAVVRRLYRHLNTGRRHTGVEVQTVWTHEIMEGEQLPFLRSQPETRVPPGTARQLRGAIDHLKTSGVNWQQLQEDSIADNVDVSSKLADLIAFYKAYEARLGSRWVDRAGIHRVVSDHLTGSPNRAERFMKGIFPNVDLVVVSGFDVFLPHDFTILTGIANLPSIDMGIVLDFDERNESLFGHIKTDYNRFLSCGFERHSEGIEIPDADRKLHFAKNLFYTDGRQHSSIEKLAATNQIFLLSPPSRVQEVEGIAKLIKRLALSQTSLALDQVCVTFYKLDAYASLIREIFPLHGIPYAMERWEKLETSTVVVSIFLLLETLQGGASLQTRQKVLQSPYFHSDDWDTVIGNCELNAGLSPQAFRETFDRLMADLKVHQQILKGNRESGTRSVAPKIEAYRKFRRVIDELVEFLIIGYGPEARHPLEIYIRRLRLMTLESVYQSGNPNGEGVRVLPLMQIKDLSFDTVILGGLVDSEFPAVFHSNTFLPSQQRGTELDQLREDRFLFYQALIRYRKRLYLLSPQYDGDTELVPSVFINELQHVADINTFAADDGTLFSTESFFKNYGAHSWENSEAERSADPVFPATISPRLDLIRHNVRVERSRTTTHNLRQYEGYLLSDPPDLLSAVGCALEQRRARTYSVNQLESYGECPFRYFSDRVLNLIPIEKAEAGLTNLEKGSLVHRILFAFYDGRRGTPSISKCKDDEFEEAVEALQQIARHHLDEEKMQRNLDRAENLFWDIEAEKLIGGHGKTGILPTFLEAERERNLEVQPYHFEVGFGLGDRSEPTDPYLGSNEPITVGEVSLRGKIDRVELGDGMFVVGDYKTGSSTPKLNDILEGRSLQIPLYIAVVKQLLEQKSSPIPRFEGDLGLLEGVGGVYYVLREEAKVELGIGDKEYNGKAFQASSRNGQLLPNKRFPIRETQTGADSAVMGSIVDKAVKCANQYVDSIANGDFGLTKHDPAKVCRYCSFKRICRVDDITGR